MTVLQNVMTAQHLRTRQVLADAVVGTARHHAEERDTRDRAMELLKIFDLDRFADEPATSLPYGSQRRLEIARALATEPKLLLLDEPAAGMNPQEADRADAAHPMAARRVQADDPARRAQHEGRHGHLRDDPGDRLRREIAIGTPGRDSEEPEGHRGVPWRRLSGSMLSARRTSNVFYGAIHALRDVSLDGQRGRGRDADRRQRRRKVDDAARDHRAAGAQERRVTFEGEDITGLPPHKLVARGISMSPEGRGVFANLTVLENLEMGAYLTKRQGGDQAGPRARLHAVPAPEGADQAARGHASGGEQQMLAIARALMSRPKLLLLDEPSLGLAPIVCQTIFSTIDEIKAAGTTVLLVEQNANAALKHSDRGYVLETGEVILEGTAARLPAIRASETPIWASETTPR